MQESAILVLTCRKEPGHDSCQGQEGGEKVSTVKEGFNHFFGFLFWRDCFVVVHRVSLCSPAWPRNLCST